MTDAERNGALREINQGMWRLTTMNGSLFNTVNGAMNGEELKTILE